MKKLLFAVLISALCAAAQAEWTKYAENTNDGRTGYFDRSTIRRSGSTVKVWIVDDFAAEQVSAGTSYRSMRSQILIDCEEETSTITGGDLWDGPMLGGKIVSSSGNNRHPPMEPIAPKTAAAVLMNLLCKRAAKRQASQD
jgi:hypothetical protein